MTFRHRLAVVALLVLVPATGKAAHAQVGPSETNVQEGDNSSESDQSGAADSGDSVAGQVVGVVSAGDASVDATNRSEDVEAETGDADGSNSSASFTGLNLSSSTTILADLFSGPGDFGGNLQEGDNDYDVTQAANAASGDAVVGEVIGVVTAAGGSASVVAANTSIDSEASTGDADAENDAAAFVGLNGLCVCGGRNIQEGDNGFDGSQSADAASGDGVGGQVLGVVSAGDTTVDATNLSDGVDVPTGGADAENDAAAFVGLDAATTTVVGPLLVDIINEGNADNVQEGDNSKDLVQAADASSGDAVAGQVNGVVTSAGGSADLVLANTSVDIDLDSGDSEFENSDASFTGLNSIGEIAVF